MNKNLPNQPGTPARAPRQPRRRKEAKPTGTVSFVTRVLSDLLDHLVEIDTLIRHLVPVQQSASITAIEQSLTWFTGPALDSALVPEPPASSHTFAIERLAQVAQRSRRAQAQVARDEHWQWAMAAGVAGVQANTWLAGFLEGLRIAVGPAKPLAPSPVGPGAAATPPE